MRTALMRGSWVVAFAGLLLAGGLVQPVEATLVTFDFTGTITGVASSLTTPSNPFASPSIVGSFSYDAPQTPTSSGTGWADYMEALTALTFQFGAYTGGSPTATNFVTVYDDFPQSGSTYVDALVMGAIFNATHPGGDPINGLLLYSFDLQLNTVPATSPTNALTSTALPTTAPTLSAFPVRGLHLAFTGGGGSHFDVTGTLDSLTLATAPVPEPSTLLIAASGFLTWGAMAWRRHRRG